MALSLLALLIAGQVAQAGSFGDFFHSLFSKPKHKISTHRATHKGHKGTDKATSREVSKNQPSDGASHTSPSEVNIRTATQASRTKGSKGDLRYGIPVPDKKGLVTSPFAPDSGYIDVRSFPPGTPVKDPYTGKTFLTP